MSKTTVMSVCALAAVSFGIFGTGVAEAKSGGIQLPVTPLALPDPVRSVSPAQGIINLDGSDFNGSPLGAGNIALTFSSAPTVNPDMEEGLYFKIFVDGAEEPAELLPCEKATVDIMGAYIGGFTFKGKYTQKGIYHIEIPAGVWIVKGEESPAVELNYEVTNDYFINPPAGVVDKITEFEIIFPSSFETTYKGGLKIYKERTNIDYDFDVVPVDPEPGAEQNTFRIVLKQPLTDPYIYILEMPRGTFEQKWYGPDFSTTEGVREIKSEQQVLKFTIPDVAIPAITPSNEAPLFSFDKFDLDIKSDGEFSLTVNDKVGNFLYPADEEWTMGSIPFARLYAPQEMVKGNKMSLVFVDAIGSDGVVDPDFTITPPPGNYVLQLDPNVFSLFMPGKAPLAAAPYTYRYTVIADPTVSQALPGSGQYSKIDEVEIRFPNAECVTENPECAQKITVLNADGTPVDGVEVTITGGGIAPSAEDDDYNGASVTLNVAPALVEKGDYTLVVPQGFFSCDSFPNNEITLNYSIDGTQGIDTVNVDNGLVTVYTATGIRVLDKADASALETLAPGIYIVNGKKVVIK